ncbi:hypothetical protein [Actinoallomurus soli]|uniref:hypothetical protein n=1 Tax=Actinoallomurus soli TaxID=2952535 RepID=UPI0020929628|nr:hypothetical protein [Actinoallomurus soli]MCO5974399.1 hypothetical protein [Actinoallomurus soli]
MNEPPPWLRSALREEADAHRPDGDHMWSRVEAGARSRRDRTARGRSVVAAALAAAGVAAVAVGVVTWRSEGPADPAVPAGHGSAPSDRPSPSAASTWASAGPTSRAGTPSPTGRPTGSSAAPQRSRAAAPDVAAGLGPGTNDYWAQENVTVSEAKPLTTLRVTVRVARTQNVRSTGSWSSLPGDTYQVTVGEERNAIVYTWTVRSGRPVPPGRYVFAAQYARAPGGHDVHQDSYTVTTADGAGRPFTQSGRF